MGRPLKRIERGDRPGPTHRLLEELERRLRLRIAEEKDPRKLDQLLGYATRLVGALMNPHGGPKASGKTSQHTNAEGEDLSPEDEDESSEHSDTPPPPPEDEPSLAFADWLPPDERKKNVR